MENAQRIKTIESRLVTAFSPETIHVEDESHLHRGHEGAKDGRGHFKIMVISDAFKGLSLIARHRLVYQALGEMMQTDIHALSMDVYSSEEI